MTPWVCHCGRNGVAFDAHKTLAAPNSNCHCERSAAISSLVLCSLDGPAAVGYDESDNCRWGGFALANYFGDSLRTLTTLLLLGVLGYMGITIGNRRKIAFWGKRVVTLAILGFIACIFAAARDGYHLSVQAANNPDSAPGLFAMDSAQSILGSLGGMLMVIGALSCLFVKKQTYRKAVFFILSVIITAKILLIEIARTGL